MNAILKFQESRKAVYALFDCQIEGPVTAVKAEGQLSVDYVKSARPWQ